MVWWASGLLLLQCPPFQLNPQRGEPGTVLRSVYRPLRPEGRLQGEAAVMWANERAGLRRALENVGFSKGQ